MLHTVGYQDGDRPRPILHRASVSEMVVPYADPDTNWNWRSAFDQGEYGLGRTCSSLTAGQDVPENAVLLDAVFADDRGRRMCSRCAVAVYEQDGGLLWKHFDFDFEHSARRRARKPHQLHRRAAVAPIGTTRRRIEQASSRPRTARPLRTTRQKTQTETIQANDQATQAT